MISADVKADVKQQEIQELVAVSCNFLYKYLQNFMYFSFNFANYYIQFEIVRWEQGRVWQTDEIIWVKRVIILKENVRIFKNFNNISLW